MNTPTVLLAMMLLIGMLAGGLLVAMWLILVRRRHYIMRSEVEAQYVDRRLYEDQGKRFAAEQQKNAELQQRQLQQATELAWAQSQASHLEAQIADSQQQLRLQFEQLANQLLEEKSAKFTRQNAGNIEALLSPLREQMKHFHGELERQHRHSSEDRISLREELKHLRSLNEQLSQDANNLVSALKGDTKAQGDWGEWQLERLLEASGLQREVHYQAQPTFHATSGQLQRPDFIIRLPEERHLILDSKVSLVAYDRWCVELDEPARKAHLRQHIQSLRQHIQGLSGKNYPRIEQLKSPDFLLLFVPIEPALSLALQEEPKLFSDALERNIVLVSNTTLLIALRTIAFSWKQERQKNNVREIARQSGLLYDKFCGFVEDIRTIGQRLDQAQSAYKASLNKLSESVKYGDTLIGRAERIRELGARTSKRLPQDMLPDHDPEADPVIPIDKTDESAAADAASDDVTP